MRSLTYALPLSLLLASCAGSSGDVSSSAAPALPAADLSGAWSGTWLSRTGVSGSTTSTFEQSGNIVEGEIRFTGSPCFAGGVFSGSLHGRELSGTLRAGSITVEMSATVGSQSIDGSYETISAGACTGDTGTFTSSR